MLCWFPLMDYTEGGFKESDVVVSTNVQRKVREDLRKKRCGGPHSYEEK